MTSRCPGLGNTDNGGYDMAIFQGTYYCTFSKKPLPTSGPPPLVQAGLLAPPCWQRGNGGGAGVVHAELLYDLNHPCQRVVQIAMTSWLSQCDLDWGAYVCVCVRVSGKAATEMHNRQDGLVSRNALRESRGL